MAEDLNPAAVKYYADAIGAVPSRLETFLRAMAQRMTDLDDENFHFEATRLADHSCVVVVCTDGGACHFSFVATHAEMAAFLRGENVQMPDFVALATPDVKTAVAFEAALNRRTSQVQ